MITGFDPGAQTGVAQFAGGKLIRLETIQPYQLEERIAVSTRVIFEDSRLINHVYIAKGGLHAQLKMARNVGEIDAWCKLIVALCEIYNVPAHGISPKAKGPKLDAVKFGAVTGWMERSNQHERDAAMCAWQYRGAK